MTFTTADQMLAANEMFLSSGPFVLAKPEYRRFTTPVIGESYLDSRTLLGTLVASSGMGVHILWGPAFDSRSTGVADPASRQQVLMEMMMKFAQMTGATPPANPWPVFLEFEAGNPHFAQAPVSDSDHDFATLRWAHMVKLLSPAALGQTLFKQALWAEDFFSGSRKTSEGQTLMGTDPDAGFSGFVLTAEALNKLMSLQTDLAYDAATGTLGSIDPASYDPAQRLQYYPHQIALAEAPVASSEYPLKPYFIVSDISSDLYDQWSLLWGLSEFYWFANPTKKTDSPQMDANFRAIFDGSIFPREAAGLAQGLSLVVYKNLKAMHFDPEAGVFVDRWSPSGRERSVSAFNAGYVLVALANLEAQKLMTPQGVLDPSSDIRRQADFIVAKLIDPRGGAYDGYILGRGPDSSPKTLLAQTALIRGLLAAFAATGEPRYKAAALTLANTLIERFYDPAFRGFATTLGEAVYSYTPQNLAVTLGALRELALIGEITEASRLYTELFQTVVDGQGHEGSAMFMGAAKDNSAFAPVLAGEIDFSGATSR
ncbi:hypothetical protein HY230_04290 [Candidatus Acetothermia bacterium]|nr:hypothetical protein [Candidatus Acetothermia bacterium]